MRFYGREDILVDLEGLWGKKVASLVTCRGRRRIGKSTLIKRFAELSDARFIKIEGLRPDDGMSNEDELSAFAEQLSLYAEHDIPIAKNWLNAFNHCMRAFMIHGHIHGNTNADYWPYLQSHERILNASVEVNNYEPVTFDELVANNQKFKSVHRDRHQVSSE